MPVATRHFLLLLIVGVLLFFVGLGSLPLVEPDEGRNAEVAREMLVSGDWVTPHYNSLAYLDKPAVYFWLVAGSFRVLGTSEFAARLPSALAALGTLLLVWWMARKMFGEAVGLRAAVIWASTPLVIIFSRQVIFDMTLTLLVTLSMLAFWIDSTSAFKRPWLEMLMFAAWGVAAITKGLVGFLLPLLSLLAYQALAGRWRELKRLRWGFGTFVFLAASLPWFLTVCMRHPDFVRYAFWQESLQRFATGSAQRGGSPGGRVHE
jgi:4-amino-4-deoxy-L-arabinose transferase-like glycosyltransferase